MPRPKPLVSESAPEPLKPYYDTPDKVAVRLYHGHVIDVLKQLPRKSVQCVVTSPPYWGLRDYGTGTWVGGDGGCDHGPTEDWITSRFFNSSTLTKNKGRKDNGQLHAGQLAAANSMWSKEIGSECPRCGAKRIDQQIGSEPIPDCGTHGKAQCGSCFICTMVAVFTEVRRVLRDDGTLFLNLGDSYGASSGNNPSSKSTLRTVDTRPKPGEKYCADSGGGNGVSTGVTNLSPGNLVGIPWRTALALQANGWVLRQDIIWNKVNPMPESVTNRCTKAHEYVFLLTKGMDYYYDAEAIKDKSKDNTLIRDKSPRANNSKNLEAVKTELINNINPDCGDYRDGDGFSNKRSVWQVASKPYKGAHFATFPPDLIRPMILAGTSAHGACVECGVPWRRDTDEGCEGQWILGNACPGHSNNVVPCTVLDPFMGSGTTAQVCIELSRRCIGIELNEKYIVDNAIPRIEDTGILFKQPSREEVAEAERKLFE